MTTILLGLGCGNVGTHDDQPGDDIGATPDAPASSGSVRVEPTSLGFGEVAVGAGRRELALTVTNAGGAPGAVSTAQTGPDAGSFGVVEPCPTALAAGDSCVLRVFAAAASLGDHTAGLDVSIGGSTTAVPLAMTGVDARLVLSVTADEVGDLALGAVADRTYTLSNISSVELTGLAIAITGDPAVSLASTTCGATLGSGADCDLAVRVAPTALGAISALVTASASGTGAATSVSITGRAVATVEVTRAGDGVGVVSGAPISCGASCTAIVDASPFQLTAAPAAGSRFAGWGGAAAGCSAATCDVPVTAATTSVIATFADLPTLTVSVAVSGSGLPGDVIVSSPADTCGGTCSYEYPGTTSVTLEAVENAADCIEFLFWSGGCSGQSLTCDLSVAADTAVTATFHRQSGCTPL